jgi:sugar/nucleoside kinase (ribokinase family)
MRTEFQFRSKKFNCTEQKDYFINPGCFGDDLSEWLIERLENAGFRITSNPDQEDFGWYFTFLVQNVEHCVVVSFQPSEPEKGDRWVGWVERHLGFIGSILGGRNRGILPEAIQAVDLILTNSDEIRFIGWFDHA